jgi:hypothetical protein
LSVNFSEKDVLFRSYFDFDLSWSGYFSGSFDIDLGFLILSIFHSLVKPIFTLVFSWLVFSEIGELVSLLCSMSLIQVFRIEKIPDLYRFIIFSILNMAILAISFMRNRKQVRLSQNFHKMIDVLSIIFFSRLI